MFPVLTDTVKNSSVRIILQNEKVNNSNENYMKFTENLWQEQCIPGSDEYLHSCLPHGVMAFDVLL